MRTYELWRPLTEEENELAKLCQKFCHTCDTYVIERHGKGKERNQPFQYFMYWDILSKPHDDECYKQNRAAFDGYMSYVREHKAEFETEIEKARRQK